MPQAQFLEFLTAQAARYPAFELVMRVNVRELVEQDGVVHGVRYHAPDGVPEVRAALTVGADGRFSQSRRLSGLKPVITAATIDVLWLRLPRLLGDPEGATGGIGRGHMLLLRPQGTLVVAAHSGFIDTRLAEGFDVPKHPPGEVAAQILDAVELGREEVLADERTRAMKASLPNDLELIYPAIERQWAAEQVTRHHHDRGPVNPARDGSFP